MHNAMMGAYELENHVVVFELDREISWAPALPGQQPIGHTYIWHLTPAGDDGTTEVTQTYDWSAMTDPQLLAHFPVVTADDLAASLRRVEEALAEPAPADLMP